MKYDKKNIQEYSNNECIVPKQYNYQTRKAAIGSCLCCLIQLAMNNTQPYIMLKKEGLFNSNFIRQSVLKNR